MSTTPLQRLFLLALGLCLALTVGCRQQAPPPGFVARVGETYLTQDDVNAALEGLPSSLDSAEARRLFVNQWVTNELLFQEALRHNLRAAQEVQRRLAESERAVLIDALVSQLFEENAETPSAAEVLAYFERNKEQLRLREPFVRVRYLHTADADSAQLARTLLQQSTPATADSVWTLLTNRFAADPTLSQSLASNYFPESRLFMEQPELHDLLARLSPGQTAPLLESNGSLHLLHVADRVPAGTLPESVWVEDEIRRQLTLDLRKQMYERQVQRLRTEALSREELVVR